MSNKVYVVGVGMTKFEKPGRREGWDYPDMARESGTNALQDAGVDYTDIEQGYVGYVAGDSTQRAARPLRTGHDGHPDRQCQQQLLHRVHGAVSGCTGHPRRTGRLRAGAGLREDAARTAEWRRPGPGIADGQARQGVGRDRRVRFSGGAVDVRGRRPRAHEEIRHHRGAFRQDRPTRTTSTRSTTRTRSSRRSTPSTTSWPRR